MTHEFFRSIRPVSVCAALLFVLAACATAPTKNIEKFTRGTSGLTVLLMPMDVELSEVSAGGVHEPKADWTEAAEKNMKTAIEKIMAGRNAKLVPYVPPAGDSASARDQRQLVKLHSVVGAGILRSEAGLVLPTKQDKFDWTLGPDVRALKAQGDAEYALFVFVRDSYASSGRAAVIFIGVLLGVGLPGGRQLGFASLVDLRTGDIVWFNRLARAAGDLRNPEDAQESVEELLANLPK